VNSSFQPGNVVPGSFSPTKCCRAGCSPMAMRQRYRLGVNHHQIPVNAPRCPVNTINRTGRCGWTTTRAARSDTDPNSYGAGRSNRHLANRQLAIREAADRLELPREMTMTYYTHRASCCRMMSPRSSRSCLKTPARDGDAPGRESRSGISELSQSGSGLWQRGRGRTGAAGRSNLNRQRELKGRR
jgi:catalase